MTRRIKQLADELGLCEGTLRREIKRGHLSHHRAGKIILFTDEDVAAYIARIAVPADGLK
jgi:excisionase family DNA binding protein